MADIFDAGKRSDVMRQIKSKKNKSTELRLIEIFKQNGITGWRRNYPVKGHPDFIFPKKKIAVFVDGCFWHGHDCRNTRPADHQEYWQKKRERNIKHDKEVTAMFEARGWTVLRIWECELQKKNLDGTVEKIKLQMYAIATQDALGLEPLKATAHFLYANQPHIKEDVELSEEQMENMKHQIANTVTAIKQGRFPLCASKTRCTSCDFKAICNGSTR